MKRPRRSGLSRTTRGPEQTHAIDYRGPSVVVDLDDDWQAVYDVTPQRDHMVITAVSIRPRHEVPPGGLTTRVTRTLHPPIALEMFREDLAQHLTHGSIEAKAEATAAVVLMARTLLDQKEVIGMLQKRWAGWGAALAEHEQASPQLSPDRLGRLAETAALYVKALDESESAPSERVADIQGRTSSKVRDDVRAARRAGLLTEPPGRGRAGGTLTDKAREILGSD